MSPSACGSGCRGDTADLDRAIADGAQPVREGSSSPGRQPGRLSNLGTALRLRARGSPDPDRHDAAVEPLASAARAAGPGHPRLPANLTNLAVAELQRFLDTGRAAGLDRALDSAERAALLVDRDDPEWALCASNLGVIRTRYREHHDDADLERAVVAWRSAWTSGAPAVTRFRAAHAAADALARAGVVGRNPQTWVRHAAAEAYEIALRVLPAVVWPGLAATTREEVLAGLDGFATAAAAAALALGEHDQALRHLEAGRSLLWQQRILPTADCERLGARDAPAAARLSRLQVALIGVARPR